MTPRRNFGTIRRLRTGWQARYVHPDGSRRAKSHPTRELAELWLSKLEIEIARGEVLGEQSITAIGFAEFTEHYLSSIERRQSEKTVSDKRYRIQRLRDAFGRKYVHEVTTADVTRLRTECYRDNLTHASVNRTLALASAVFEEAIRLQYATQNPVRGVRREKERKRKFPYLDLAQQDAVIRACSDIRAELGSCCKLTLETGLRVGELIRLRWRDTSIGRRELTVHESKNRRPRTVMLTTRACDALRQLGAEAGEADGFVCPWRSHDGYLSMRWRKARVTAGFPSLRWHDLRHLFACNVLAATQDMATVARLLGTTMAVATNTYADHAPANFRIHALSGLERLRAKRPDEPESTTGNDGAIIA